MTQEETDKIFYAITSNGCRDMDKIRFNQAVNEALQIVKNCSIPDVSARLSSSLGECVEGNDYEIVADKDGRFWINHKEVGSGEPLEQWIDSVLNVR